MVILSKRLSDTDATIRLEVPAATLQHFCFPSGQLQLNLEVIDSAQRVWELCLSKRRVGPYAKPSMRHSGWSRFATAHRLRKGDRVTIYGLQQDEAGGGVHYRIAVKKENVIKLFGKFMRPDDDQVHPYHVLEV